MDQDLIIGFHSIACALKNEKRVNLELFCTDEGLREFSKKYPMDKNWKDGLKITTLSSHSLQEEAKFLYNELDFQFNRVPGGVFLMSESLPQEDLGDVYEGLENGSDRLIILDGVTDIHNMAAICRSAVFFGIKYIIVARKGGVRLSPAFFRIASGATEYLNLVNVSSLPKAIKSLTQRGVTCVGLSEHECPIEKSEIRGICALVLGEEENGLSNAVKRIIDKCFALDSQGQIKSLNVSVAAAVAMEKFWGKC